MLVSFFSCVVSTFFAIDFGSQNLKFAESTLSGFPRLIKTPQGKTTVPSAFAIKSKNPINFPLNTSVLENVSFKYGTEALSILKKNPRAGMKYPTFLVGRSLFFKQSDDPITFSGMVLANLISQATIYEDNLAVVVPANWLTYQSDSLNLAFHLFNIPCRFLLDDIHALACYYNVFHGIKQGNRSVLYVDVGGISTKISGLQFISKKDQTVVNEVLYDWSENIGGIHFTNGLASLLNISTKKAHKMLQMDETANVSREKIHEFKTLLGDSVKTMIAKVGGIDEVHLIGGASSFKFIVDVVKEFFGNEVRVFRSANHDEPLAVGGVIALLEVENLSIWKKTNFNPISKFTVTITCNTTTRFCQKGNKCLPIVVEPNTRGCDAIYINISSQIPVGLPTGNISYRLTNLTNFTIDENSRARFRLYPHKPILKEVVWCNSSFCEKIEFEQLDYPDYQKTSLNTVRAIYLKEQEMKIINSIIPKIDELIQRIGNIVDNPTREPAIKYQPLSASNVEKYKSILKSYTDGDFSFMNKTTIMKQKKDLENILKSLVPRQKITKPNFMGEESGEPPAKEQEAPHENL